MASITPVNSGRQSYKGVFYNPSVATQQCICTYYVGGHSITTGTEICHFWHPRVDSFLYSKRGPKQTFFEPLFSFILSTHLLNGP